MGVVHKQAWSTGVSPSLHIINDIYLHIINRKICVSVCLSVCLCDRDLSSSERKKLLTCGFLQKLAESFRSAMFLVWTFHIL